MENNLNKIEKMLIEQDARTHSSKGSNLEAMLAKISSEMASKAQEKIDKEKARNK